MAEEKMQEEDDLIEGESPEEEEITPTVSELKGSVTNENDCVLSPTPLDVALDTQGVMHGR